QLNTARSRKIMTGNGMGPSLKRSIARKSEVKRHGAFVPSGLIIPEDTVWPLTGISFHPVMTNIIANVANKSRSFNHTLNIPVTKPASATAIITTTIATLPVFAQKTMVIAANATDIPATDQTERSIPHTPIVNVTPNPKIATTEANFNMEKNVDTLRNDGSEIAK